MPSPFLGDKATAFSIQVVMLSGAFNFLAALPVVSVVRPDQTPVSGKNWRTRWTSASPLDCELSVALFSAELAAAVVAAAVVAPASAICGGGGPAGGSGTPRVFGALAVGV